MPYITVLSQRGISALIRRFSSMLHTAHLQMGGFCRTLLNKQLKRT
ncbi:MAG: hypothetical protein RR271_03120 [Oscillospiraceae bacterium]